MWSQSQRWWRRCQKAFPNQWNNRCKTVGFARCGGSDRFVFVRFASVGRSYPLEGDDAMAKRDVFKEVKIGLVMKLHKISRDAAVAEIARMDAERRAEEGKGKKVALRRGGSLSQDLVPEEYDEFMSAEEFFKGV